MISRTAYNTEVEKLISSRSNGWEVTTSKFCLVECHEPWRGVLQNISVAMAMARLNTVIRITMAGTTYMHEWMNAWFHVQFVTWKHMWEMNKVFSQI